MKAHQFIAALVEAAGGSNRVALAMRAKTFQGTLHRICQGTSTPTRASAERIAAHFGIPVDAVYDDDVAAQLHRRLIGTAGGAPPASTSKVTPVVIPLPAPAWPLERFPYGYWESLTPAERAIVEEAMLEAYDRLMARREQLRTATGKTVRPAA